MWDYSLNIQSTKGGKMIFDKIDSFLTMDQNTEMYKKSMVVENYKEEARQLEISLTDYLLLQILEKLEDKHH